MLRGNLSTRPFYNERAVQFGLTIVAVVLSAVTAFTVWQLWALTAQQRELGAAEALDAYRKDRSDATPDLSIVTRWQQQCRELR